MSADRRFAGGADVGWDRVAAQGAGGVSWTRAQFEKLPLVDRVRLLASGELRFFRADAEVSSRDAVKAL